MRFSSFLRSSSFFGVVLYGVVSIVEEVCIFRSSSFGVLEFDNLNSYAGTLSLGKVLIIWTIMLGQMS